MDYTMVKRRLSALRSDCVFALKSGAGSDSIEEKRQIEAILRWIAILESCGISPGEVIPLPMTQTQTPSSTFRIIDDNESDDRNCWTDLTRSNDAYFLYPGDVIMKKPRI